MCIVSFQLYNHKPSSQIPAKENPKVRSSEILDKIKGNLHQLPYKIMKTLLFFFVI